MNTKLTVFALAIALTAIQGAPAQSAEGNTVPVTADNFVRAETDLYFDREQKEAGGLAKFHHRREPIQVENQTVIRMNRDTLYSGAVFDLDAGPVTIMLPDAGKRFMSMQVISQDHYTPMVVYRPGPVTLSKDNVGTRHVIAAVRTLVDPKDRNDVQQVHALQDAIQVSEPGGPGRFEIPNWDQPSQKKVRDALLVLGSALPDSKGMFGTKADVDPVRRLIGAAMAWGGNPERDATYLTITPTNNDNTALRKLTVGNVPVDGFWSISVYNAERLFREEPVQRLFGEQHHRPKGRGWLDHGQVRRLRGQNSELPADHEGLELHRAAVSPACRGPRRQLEIPGGAAGELTGCRTWWRASRAAQGRARRHQLHRRSRRRRWQHHLGIGDPISGQSGRSASR
jgi:hypothetical protein